MTFFRNQVTAVVVVSIEKRVTVSNHVGVKCVSLCT